MASELSSSTARKTNVVAENPDYRSSPDKKNQVKVPKKIHKAEREKLKRDHMNELFLELGRALEPTRQNNGKASILSDTAKLLRDLIVQVDSLRRENATLLTESRYVTLEKNELKDDTTALGAEIEKLQTEIRERMRSNPAWANHSDTTPSLQQPASTTLPTQQPPAVGPMYVIPLHQDLQHYPETMAEPFPAPKPSSHVRRPHARYPTPSDSWPHQILSQQPRTNHSSGSSSTTTTNSNGGEEEGSAPRELNLLD